MTSVAEDRLRSQRNQVIWQRIDPDGPGLHAPQRHNDIGWDLEAADTVLVEPGQQRDISTNIRLHLPETIWAEVRARSSIAKRHLQIEAGTIDPGYRGPIYALLRNLIQPNSPLYGPVDRRNDTIQIKKGERVAQIVFHRVCPVWAEEGIVEIDTERGEGGFGSTGR